MANERRDHLEGVAAQLTLAFYTARTEQAPEHRDILETYFFLLDALLEHDGEGKGIPLRAGDTMAPFEDSQ